MRSILESNTCRPKESGTNAARASEKQPPATTSLPARVWVQNLVLPNRNVALPVQNLGVVGVPRLASLLR